MTLHIPQDGCHVGKIEREKKRKKERGRERERVGVRGDVEENKKRKMGQL